MASQSDKKATKSVVKSNDNNKTEVDNSKAINKSKNEIISAMRKHDIAVGEYAVDELVKEIHRVLEEKKQDDLMDSLEKYLSDIVKTVKENLEDESKKAAKLAKGKKVKDPNAPKRAPTAYNIFIKETMARLKEEHGGEMPKDAMQLATAEWNALPSDDERKKKTTKKTSKKSSKKTDDKKMLSDSDEDVKKHHHKSSDTESDSDSSESSSSDSEEEEKPVPKKGGKAAKK